MQTILITGGAGFVGSGLALLLKEKYPAYHIICFDNLKRRGSELNLSRFKEKQITFVHGDVRNKEDFESLPPIDCIIEASAEPSVLAGIGSTPDYLINTNLNGTLNCLNFSLKNNSTFIFLSTSRVYPIAPLAQVAIEESDTRFVISKQQPFAGISEKGISELFPLQGYRSLYGMTKLASELAIEEYAQFYGLKTVVNRCGVISGAWQMGKVDQGVVVLWMARHFWKKNLSYIGYNGSGKQVRDILHLKDLFRLIDQEIQNIDQFNGLTLNVGGGHKSSASLAELTTLCSKITGNVVQIEREPVARQADIPLYITDNSKVTEICGWQPELSTEDVLTDIFEWLRNNEHSLKPILS